MRLDEGAPLPAVEQVAGLVVMGGPMGAFDDDEEAFAAAVKLFGRCGGFVIARRKPPVT